MVKFMKSAVFRIDLAYPFFCGMVISAFICSSAVYPRLIAKTDPFAREPLAAAPLSPEQMPELAPETTLRRIGGGYPAGTIQGKPVNIPDPGFSEDDYAVTGDANGNYLVVEPEGMSTAALPSFVPPPLSVSVRRSKEDDLILKAYRDSATRERVAAFFGGIMRSPELAYIILDNADVYNIPPSLAFALCWEESRFNTQAVNRANQNGSVDRGLFQLNNKSFPQIAEQDFFNPRLNASYGLSHLRWCLDTGGSLVAGIAMYNAGTNRVADGGTPKRTLDYVSHVLDSQSRIEDIFDSHGVLSDITPLEAELPDTPPRPAPGKPRLALLRPVSWRP
ncbi:hypothetical protein FACS1894124_4280 [Spirochaetia bacterium]|nr:hypothetical protein FACS1894124_4280 [Spirochaetia bacterium]